MGCFLVSMPQLRTSPGDEWEINYFQKQYGKWTLKDGDLDSCDAEDMILVMTYPDK